MIPRVLAIAGSDSGGGAGIQADIKTITMLGGHAMTAITAITAQNTIEVARIMPVPAEMVLAQIDAVVRDIGVDAIKIGMLGSSEVAEAVAERLRAPDLADVPVVFDPVMVASSGARLSDARALPAMLRLMDRATVSTPNIEELAILSGMKISGIFEVDHAAMALLHLGPVLVTGIRFPGGKVHQFRDGLRAEMSSEAWPVDWLFWMDGAPQRTGWSAERIPTRHDHGTGCTLSSAIACGLANGSNLPDAIGFAREYVRAALRAAPGLGQGHGPMGHGLGKEHFF